MGVNPASSGAANEALATASPRRGGRGFFVVVQGPDGSGKSALARELSRAAEPHFSGIVRIHLYPRPRFMERLDRKRSQQWETASDGWRERQHQRGFFRSLLQAAWFTVRCWIGYLSVIWPERCRCRLVVVERWNLDLITAPRSKGIVLPERWCRFFYRLGPPPDLIILLEGDSRRIRIRKPELDEAEIQRRMDAARTFFNGYPHAMFLDGLADLSELTAVALDAVLRRCRPESR